ncbi:MAG: hypothetical protein IJ181_01220 [Acidaminococcaceae bacterium]|nr:hypothetical protein [Acidaminococcaceae bacterium]
MLKDLGKIKNSLWYSARKYGCDSIGLDYENAVGYIEFAIKDIKDAKLNAKMAERKRKKCES